MLDEKDERNAHQPTANPLAIARYTTYKGWDLCLGTSCMPPRCGWPSHATNPQGLPAPHIAQLTRTTTLDALTPHPSHYLTYKGAIPPHALNYTRVDPCPIAITIQASNNQGAQMPQPLANFRFLLEAD